MPAAFSPAQPALVKLGAADPVERWRRHTLDGNLAFERGEDIKARQEYSEALAVAEELMASAARAHDARAARFAPALYGVSCNDIIALARRQEDGLTVGIFLCKLADGYLTVMENLDAPAALRARCLLHSRVASAALCSYFEERGMWDAAETYTTRANAAFFSVQRRDQGVEPPAAVALTPSTPAEPSSAALAWNELPHRVDDPSPLPSALPPTAAAAARVAGATPSVPRPAPTGPARSLRPAAPPSRDALELRAEDLVVRFAPAAPSVAPAVPSFQPPDPSPSPLVLDRFAALPPLLEPDIALFAPSAARQLPPRRAAPPVPASAEWGDARPAAAGEHSPPPKTWPAKVLTWAFRRAPRQSLPPLGPPVRAK